jgi:hypothetical protein
MLSIPALVANVHRAGRVIPAIRKLQEKSGDFRAAMRAPARSLVPRDDIGGQRHVTRAKAGDA